MTERIHYAVGSGAHDVSESLLHGCCAACVVPWPCPTIEEYDRRLLASVAESKVWVVSRDTEDGEHSIEGVFTVETVADSVADIVDLAVGQGPDFVCNVSGHELNPKVDDIRETYA